MKKFAFLACLFFMLGATFSVNAEDLFDKGQMRMSASEVLLNMGIYAITHPDSVKEALDGPKPDPKTKDEMAMDKKVDDAIKKAWEVKE